MPWKNNCNKEQRWRFIERYLRKQNSVSELCRRCAISRKTAYKWIGRFELRGRWGLSDQRRVAHRVHNRPTGPWLKRIKRWRRQHPSWGAAKIRWALERRFGSAGLPSESAISRWLQRWGLSRKRRRQAHKGPRVDRPTLSKARHANDVWTVDFKGWFRTRDGTRVEPLTVRDLASRYVLAISLRRKQNVEDCRGVFERIFRNYGMPSVIRCDNGSPFGSTGALGLTRLSAWWVRLGIGVEYIEPGHPEQNGAHEQLHRVYKQETAQPAAESMRAQQRRSEAWRRHYNEERPHEGLGMRVPAQLYRKSRRAMPGRLTHWRYEREWQSRLVKGKGMISFKGRSRFVGEAFERQRVGIKWIEAGVWAVHFGPHLIGELWDKDQSSGIRAVWHRKRRAKFRTDRFPDGSASVRYAHLRSTIRKTI
jgi:putative transposase